MLHVSSAKDISSGENLHGHRSTHYLSNDYGSFDISTSPSRAAAAAHAQLGMSGMTHGSQRVSSLLRQSTNRSRASIQDGRQSVRFAPLVVSRESMMSSMGPSYSGSALRVGAGSSTQPGGVGATAVQVGEMFTPQGLERAFSRVSRMSSNAASTSAVSAPSRISRGDLSATLPGTPRSRGGGGGGLNSPRTPQVILISAGLKTINSSAPPAIDLSRRKSSRSSLNTGRSMMQSMQSVHEDEDSALRHDLAQPSATVPRGVGNKEAFQLPIVPVVQSDPIPGRRPSKQISAKVWDSSPAAAEAHSKIKLQGPLMSEAAAAATASAARKGRQPAEQRRGGLRGFLRLFACFKAPKVAPLDMPGAPPPPNSVHANFP